MHIGYRSVGVLALLALGACNVAGTTPAATEQFRYTDTPVNTRDGNYRADVMPNRVGGADVFIKPTENGKFADSDLFVQIKMSDDGSGKFAKRWICRNKESPNDCSNLDATVPKDIAAIPDIMIEHMKTLGAMTKITS